MNRPTPPTDHHTTRDRPWRGRGDRGEVPVWVVMTGLSVILALATFAALQSALLDLTNTVVENIRQGVGG